MMFYLTATAYNARTRPTDTPLDIFRDLVDDGSLTTGNSVVKLPRWGDIGTFGPYYVPVYNLNYASV